MGTPLLRLHFLDDPQAVPKREQPYEILRRMIVEWEPVHVYVAFSGGNDSLTSSVASVEAIERLRSEGVPVSWSVLHANTGIGIEETRRYVRALCKDKGWELLEIRAKEDCGEDYDEMVVQHGFPGPAHHKKMYQRLKERCIRAAVRRAKVGKHRWSRVAILTGVRHDESEIRAGYKSEGSKVDAQVWVNPCYWWDEQDFLAFRRERSLPVNPVSKILGMSGECLCGAFADALERAVIARNYPAVHERLLALEARVEAGRAKHKHKWHERPPGRKKAKENPDDFRPMCAGCGKAELEEQTRLAA